MNKLTMREFRITVWVVPPTLECELFGAKPYTEDRVITGYTLKDAKRRALIED